MILIKTCCALHNFVRSRDGFNIQDALSEQGFVEMGLDTSRASHQSTQARNKLADYFISDVGSVPWQTNYSKGLLGLLYHRFHIFYVGLGLQLLYCICWASYHWKINMKIWIMYLHISFLSLSSFSSNPSQNTPQTLIHALLFLARLWYSSAATFQLSGYFPTSPIKVPYLITLQNLIPPFRVLRQETGRVH